MRKVSVLFLLFAFPLFFSACTESQNNAAATTSLSSGTYSGSSAEQTEDTISKMQKETERAVSQMEKEAGDLLSMAEEQ